MDKSRQNVFQFWKERDHDQPTPLRSDSNSCSKSVSVSTMVTTLQVTEASLSAQAHPGSRKLMHPPKRPPLPRKSDIKYSHNYKGTNQTIKQETGKHPVHVIKAGKKTSSGSLDDISATWISPNPVQHDNPENTSHNVSELAKALAPVLSSSHSLSHIDRTSERFSTKSLGSYRKIHSSASLSDSTEKSKKWGSFSGSVGRPSRSLSAKRKSSGFTCYLDGPEDDPALRDTPSPTLPMSPLHEVSDLARVIDSPSTDHFVPTSEQTIEMEMFWKKVACISVRNEVHSEDCAFLHAPVISKQLAQPVSKRHETISVMTRKPMTALVIVIYSRQDDSPHTIQCSGTAIVVTVIVKALRKLHNGKTINSPSSKYCLKVCGREEFLHNGLQLAEHEYVNHCQKLGTEVKLVLLEKSAADIDHRSVMTPSPTPSTRSTFTVSQQEVNNLLNSYYAKEGKFRSVLKSHREMTVCPVSLPALAQSVESCVRLLSERLSFIEPPDMIDAIFNLKRACKVATQLELEESTLFSPDESPSVNVPGTDPWISIPGGGYVITDEHVEDIVLALDVIKTSVQHLVCLYCTSFTPGYLPAWSNDSLDVDDVTCQSQILRVKVAALHRLHLPDVRKFNTMQVEVCVYYGGKAISKRAFSPHAKVSRDFFDCVVWDKWLNTGMELSCLPFESRVLFTVYGVEIPSSGYDWNKIPVAWCSIRLFDYKRTLLSGSHVLGLWVGSEPNPVDTMYSDLMNRKSMILQIGFEEHSKKLQFPQSLSRRNRTKHPGPPPNVSRTIITVGERDRLHSLLTEEQTLLWANRMSCASLLMKCPRGLPTLLMSSPSWHLPELADIWEIVQDWKLVQPTFGLELLDAHFPDIHVRERAVECLSQLSDDDLCDFLPQLVQSLRHDTYQNSPMAELLLKRVTTSKRVAHYLFWHLRLMITSDIRFKERYFTMLQAVKSLCGDQLRLQFNTQVELVYHLCAVANAVKSSSFSHRQTTLVKGLQSITDKLLGPFSLPLNPAMVAKGISIESCFSFNSNTVPLKLAFTNVDHHGSDIEIIFKVGDDLRQDILILQMIKVMEKIWLRSGLDLRMITYQCVATGVEEGMLEMVTGASTLRAIQTEHGVTGSFKDKPLSEWLMRHNPSEQAYKEAVENFTLSCAGYCVATFILGICDRHNDNIMVKKSGHLFHIDFGKILGNAQMLGNIKRDRAPFVLTKDMAYVINDGDRPTTNFQRFTDLCCTAYNELRKHSSLLLSLLSLMLSTGLPELSTMDDIQYVSDALLPRKSEAEATFAFTKYIEDSLGSLATPVNFFMHNLAQFKFSGVSNAPTLLSFSPQAYSIETDGKVITAVIMAFHKRFYPDTHYVYRIEVSRDNCPTKTVVFRRYKEFDELHRKLVQCFPEDPLPQLPGKIFTPGKSRTKETSERRQTELNKYLRELNTMDCRVSESDIVYTFLHCLIRDEQDLGKLREEQEGLSSTTVGKVKLEVSYKLKQQCLTVMVRHVKDLVPREGVETADPYVKVYLLPDFNKSTKQKTKISRRTLHPTYNQMFLYTVPQSAISTRSLQVSVWDASNVVNKQCLCVDTIKLLDYKSQLLQGTSISDWFELTPFSDST